jgi:hypothetical protein
MYSFTQNGAVSLQSPDQTGIATGRLSLFFKGVRGLRDTELFQYLQKASEESLLDTFLLVFNLRDCRGGKGERDLGRNALSWLLTNHKELFVKVVSEIPNYGRWDDILFLIGKYPNENSLIDIFCNQLLEDVRGMQKEVKISLCAKWAPTEGCILDKKYGLVRKLCNTLHITPATYRKNILTPLRRYLNIVERCMSIGQLSDIDFSKVPSCALKRLKKAFEKKCTYAFSEWINKLSQGLVKLNASQLYPYELVREMRQNGANQVCTSQWNILEKQFEESGVLSDCIALVDTSPSMMSDNGTPLDVAVSLGMLISNAVKGSFHGKIITFSSIPQIVNIQDGDPYLRFSQIQNIRWGMSTNIQAVFDMILSIGVMLCVSDAQMPKRLFIISDMQFDTAVENNMTNFQSINEKYRQSGYTRPQIVFWNVNGQFADFPVSERDDGTVLISGFSTSIMKSILSAKTFSSYSVMREVLDSSRYEPIVRCLS